MLFSDKADLKVKGKEQNIKKQNYETCCIWSFQKKFKYVNPTNLNILVFLIIFLKHFQFIRFQFDISFQMTIIESRFHLP